MIPEEQLSGTVTLVFTDIEGSTRLLDELGTDAYRDALGEHRGVVREAFARADGMKWTTRGTPSSTRSRRHRRPLTPSRRRCAASSRVRFESGWACIRAHRR